MGVIIPAYNEEATIETLVNKVLAQRCVHQIIIVDDASTDNTKNLLMSLKNNSKIIIIHLDKNQGKGFAIKSALPYLVSPFTIIQDADLEYDPAEYEKLLKPLIMGNADIVFGSRFYSSEYKRVLYFWHFLGNKLLTTISNIFTNLNLSDMETCFKIMRTEILLNLNLKEKRFGIEPEITAKISKRNLRIYEVGISYYGRTYSDGKKITWKDGFRAVYCIIKYNLKIFRK